MSSGYRIVPHASDVGFEAWGPDEPALHDAAVRALAEIVSGGAAPAPESARPLAPPPPDAPAEERLMSVLEACLVEIDADDWLPVGTRTEPSGEEVLLGAPLPPEARSEGTHVKAVTWHGLSVTAAPEGLRARVLLDL